MQQKEHYLLAQEQPGPIRQQNDKSLRTLLHRMVGDDKRVFRSRILFLLGPLVALFQVELLNETNPYLNLEPDEFIMNLIWYAIVFFLFWLILGRRRRTAVVSCIFFEVIGIINHYVLEFRGRILFPHDISGARTAANVASEYDFTPDHFVYGTIALMLLYFLAVKFWMVPQKKRSYFQQKSVMILLGVATAGYIFAFFFTGWLPSQNIKTQQWRTQSNGFVLNFTIALRYSAVDKPDHYSEAQMTELTHSLSESYAQEQNQSMNLYSDTFQATDDQQVTVIGGNTGTGVRPTNIICIMNESFADMSLFDRLQVNGETLPFFNSLKENTIRGWMYSPVTGGGTANVEYEFLTGNSISFLPSGTVPYQLYVKKDQASLVSLAASQGYHCTAFHPYLSSGWNRPVVYSYMGFDDQLYQEDVVNPEYVRGYISDHSDYAQIEAITERANGEPTFIFNVTMQNHGGYNQGWYNLPRALSLTGTMFGTSSYTEQYLALMRKSDDDLRDLLNYYSKVEEPTMIVLFGDHQGKLTTTFYQQLFGKSIEDLTIEETQLEYITPFMVWTNYDNTSAKDVMISTNYLGTLTAQAANLPLTDYMKFLKNLYEELPVLNTNGFILPDGTMVEDAKDLSEAQKQLLEQYRSLSYCSLFSRFSEVDETFFRLPTAS
jgi:phosphoglycerol transferase MdoB-like AlkP superfamily enzyme